MSRVRPLRGPLRALDTAPAARPRKSFPRRSSEEKRPPYDSGPFFLLGLRPTRASGARRAPRSAPAALALRAEPRVGLRALRRASALRGGAIPTRRARGRADKPRGLTRISAPRIGVRTGKHGIRPDANEKGQVAPALLFTSNCTSNASLQFRPQTASRIPHDDVQFRLQAHAR